MKKVLVLMEDADKEGSKNNDELTELKTKHGELEIKANELRVKVKRKDDWRSESDVS